MDSDCYEQNKFLINNSQENIVTSGAQTNSDLNAPGPSTASCTSGTFGCDDSGDLLASEGSDVFQGVVQEYKRLPLKAELKSHTVPDTNGRNFKCNQCDKSFVLKDQLTRDKSTHTEKAPFECTVCEKRFSANSHWIVHMRTHTGERPYECEVCRKRFSTKWGMRRHMRIHTRERPYECEVCTKRFFEKAELTVHMMTHAS